MGELVKVPFHSTSILAKFIDDTPHIAIRPVCESLGIDFGAQLKTIKKRPWATVVESTTVGADGKNRVMAFIDRRGFTMWLATIQTGKIKNDDTRQLLASYQCEAADALDAYFNTGAAINPRVEEHRLNAIILQARSQMELCQAAKGLIHPDHLEAKARIVLARGLGEKPEIDQSRRPLYAADYLKEKNLSSSRLRSVSGVFGKRVKAAYIEKMGREPMKYDLTVANGQVRQVFAYTEADRWLLDEVWGTYYGASEVAA